MHARACARDSDHKHGIFTAFTYVDIVLPPIPPRTLKLPRATQPRLNFEYQ